MSDKLNEAPDTAGVVAPPPLIYTGALAAGLLAKTLFPTALLPRKVARLVGLPLLGAGLLLLTSLRTMRQAGTDVRPDKPTSSLVIQGLYRFTRNQIYLGFTLFYAGITALANSLPSALLLPFVLVVIRREVIEREERYLERIFGAAAAGDLVLFFDEADALFGKRSEVSDAHDRYANIEVSYLLQRLETYDGLVVLATNLQRNIDQAFLRRISVAIDFVLPEEPERRAIWARSFPPAAPVEGIDVDFLARQFKVSGGIIRNAALGAAFLAADDGTAITMRHAVLAMKREFQKMGRLRTEAEFEHYFELVD